MGTPFNPAWFRNIFDPRYQQMGQQGGFAPPPNIFNAVPVPKPPPPPDLGPQPFFATGDWAPPAPTNIPNKPQTPPYPISSPQSKYVGKPKLMKSVPNLYPELIDEGPVPGLRRGGESDPYGSTVKITQDDLKNPPYYEGYNRPPLDIDAYKNQTPDISQRAQVNAPQNFMGQPYTGGEGETEGDEINRLFGKYQPNTQWNDRLLAMLDNMPQRDENMSKWRKFGSFLTGFGLGPEAQEKATYAPYYRRLADWKLQLDPTMKGADLERQENINLRQLATQAETARIADKRADAYMFGQSSQAAKREADIARDRDKNRITERALEDRNWVFKTDRTTGHVVGMHPSQGTWDTGVMANEATPEQRHLWKLDEIKEAGAQRRLTQAAAAKLGRPQDFDTIQVYSPENNAYKWMLVHKTTGTMRPLRETASGELDFDDVGGSAGSTQPPQPPAGPRVPNYNPATGGTPPGAKPITLQSGKAVAEEEPMEEEEAGDVLSKPAENETQQIAGRKLRANQIRTNFPKYRSWIKIDRTDGMPYITEPGGWGGPTEEDFRIMNDMLDGRVPINPATVGRPPGATKKGSFITLPSGKKVWQEP